jgi:hypothetical protein
MSPSEKTLAHIAKTTGCRLDWLLTGKGEMFLPRVADAQEEIDEISAEMQESEDEYLSDDEAHEEDRRKARRQNISSLLTKTAMVLESDTIHANALALTINALHRAVKIEERFVPRRGLKSVAGSGKK